MKRVVRLVGKLAKRARLLRKAGGVVVRYDRGEPHVLIVSSRRRKKRWVLPKGTVEEGERPDDAALREVREEAGVVGRIVTRVGRTTYASMKGRVSIQYFLIEYRRDARSDEEDREVRWYRIEDAIHKLSFASARKMVLAAHPHILERAPRG